MVRGVMKMKVFNRLSRWMEKTLEEPLCQAEIMRAQIIMEADHETKKSGGKRHKKVIVLRPVK